MKIVPVLLLLAGLLSCASVTDPFAGASDPALLPGAPWRLVSVASPAEGSSAPRAKLTVRFTEDGRVGGMAGPNYFGGGYEASPSGEIRMGEMVGTLIGGPDAEQGAEYLRRMTRARAFEATDAELRLRLSDGGSLHFQRDPAAAE